MAQSILEKVFLSLCRGAARKVGRDLAANRFDGKWECECCGSIKTRSSTKYFSKLGSTICVRCMNKGH